jgi:hypothetical protein
LSKGEFRHFLDNVVGASCMVICPPPLSGFWPTAIQPAHGYSAAWPALDTTNAAGFQQSQIVRQKLLRELTARGELSDRERSHSRRVAVSASSRLRWPLRAAIGRWWSPSAMSKGKDVFPETPVTIAISAG